MEPKVVLENSREMADRGYVLNPEDDGYDVLVDELDDLEAVRLPVRPECVPESAVLVVSGPHARTATTENGRDWRLVPNGLFWGKVSRTGSLMLWTTQGKPVPGDWPSDSALPLLVRE